MMTREDARKIVEQELNRNCRRPGDSLVVNDEWTEVKSYGWIFYYTSKKFLETNDFQYALGGNGPIVFERDTGIIVHLGTAHAPEEEIARYEATKK